jgi:ParB/RepB/Spo0J family partition protein
MAKLETEVIDIDQIYVPAKRRGTLDEAKVETLAESIMENGQQTPIHVRPDPEKSRYVLVEGLHRLEALKALGEATIDALIVMPRRS